MGFNIQSGYGAGGGSEMLQQILAQKAREFAQAKQLEQEQQRIAIEKQRADSEDAIRRLAEQDRRTAQGATQHTAAVTGAGKLAGTLKIGQELDPSAVSALSAGDMGGTVKGPTLSSRNIGQNLTSTPNPGRGPSYLGTSGQQEDKAQGDELDRQITMAPPAKRSLLLMAKVLDPEKRAGAITEVMREGAKVPPKSPALQEYEDAKSQGYTGSFQQYQTEDANRKKTAPAMITIHTVDENGNNVTKVVPKTAGSTFAAPVNATTANRVASAETVNRLSDDMITRLSDPALAKTLGPAMGRYNTLQDFIGDPPPEFAELAGEIESFALANMGVHGMRSAQGAQKITEMLNGKQTPASLAAKIRGLSKFSNDFAEHNKPKSGASTTPPASGGPAPKVIRYDMNGNPIK